MPLKADTRETHLDASVMGQMRFQFACDLRVSEWTADLRQTVEGFTPLISSRP